jgi:hypothetical protein
MTAPKSPPQLPPPPEPLSPAMQAWWDQTRTRHSDLAAANARLREALIEAETERARNSNEGPDDYIPIKSATSYVPGFQQERVRRLCASGEIEAKQSRKGAPWKLSLTSLLRKAREKGLTVRWTAVD